VVLEVALKEPSLVRRLILVDPNPIVDESGGFGASLQQNPKATEPAAGGGALAKSVLDRFQLGDMDGGLEIFIDRVGGPGSWKNLPEARRQSLRDNAWTIKGTDKDQRRPVSCAQLGQLKIPVLLLNGDKSPTRFGAILNVIEPCIKNRVRVTIPNASHGLNRENPAAFNSAVIQFLSTH